MGRCCRRGGRCRILQPLGGRKVVCSWEMDIGRRLLCWKRVFGQMSVESEDDASDGMKDGPNASIVLIVHVWLATGA